MVAFSTFTLLLCTTVDAMYFPEYILGKDERVLFAKTPRGTVIDPPEMVTTVPLPTDSKKLSQAAIDNGASSGQKRKLSATQLKANGVWTRFNFWEAGSPANEVFQFIINKPHLLDVTDYLCSGESFTVVNLEDGEIMVSTKGRGAFDNCLTRAESPQQAWNSENFSHARHLLAAGDYKIQIYATESPAGAGKGAVRLESIRVSSKAREALRLVESKLPFRYATEVCDLFGLELAHIGSANEAIQAFKFIHDTLGPNEVAFIAGYGEPSGEGSDDSDETSRIEVNKPFYVYTGKHRGDGQILTTDGSYPPSSVICRAVETS